VDYSLFELEHALVKVKELKKQPDGLKGPALSAASSPKATREAEAGATEAKESAAPGSVTAVEVATAVVAMEIVISGAADDVNSHNTSTRNRGTSLMLPPLRSFHRTAL